MDPVLIYTDTKRIADEKAVLTKAITLFQNVYNALVAINATPTISEINNLVNFTIRGNGGPGDWLQDYATNKVIDGAGSLVVAGMTLNRDKFIQLMDALPNVASVRTALQASSAVFNGVNDIKGVRTNLLQLADGVISKVVDSDTQIATEFTYYTKTDASATLANSLQSVCDTLNTHDATFQDAIITGCGVGLNTTKQFETQFKGISILGDEFTPSLSYIRKFEQTGSLFTT